MLNEIGDVYMLLDTLILLTSFWKWDFKLI